LKFPRDTCLDYRHARRWLGQLDPDIDEGVKTQIAIGSYPRAAQTEVLDEAIGSGDGVGRHLDRYIHQHAFSPAVFAAIP
jgi:hypothetical protein